MANLFDHCRAGVSKAKPKLRISREKKASSLAFFPRRSIFGAAKVTNKREQWQIYLTIAEQEYLKAKPKLRISASKSRPACNLPDGCISDAAEVRIRRAHNQAIRPLRCTGEFPTHPTKKAEMRPSETSEQSDRMLAPHGPIKTPEASSGDGSRQHFGSSTTNAGSQTATGCDRTEPISAEWNGCRPAALPEVRTTCGACAASGSARQPAARHARGAAPCGT